MVIIGPSISPFLLLIRGRRRDLPLGLEYEPCAPAVRIGFHPPALNSNVGMPAVPERAVATEVPGLWPGRMALT